MLGAIIGDIVGSRFETRNTILSRSFKSKEFDLFTEKNRPTDDSIMTMAVSKAVFECNGDYSELAQKTVTCMQEFGRKEKYANYGGTFRSWIWAETPEPYNSFGNGAGMRISPVAFIAKSLDECKVLSKSVTEVTHNHPEGLKGGEAVAVCCWMARHGSSKEELRDCINENYYSLDFTIEQIRPGYSWDVTCQGSIPQSIKCFLESTDYEDCIRNAVSLGGDSDTMAAIAGGIAECYYGLPDEVHKIAEQYCRADMFCYVQALEVLYNGYEGPRLTETEHLISNR